MKKLFLLRLNPLKDRTLGALLVFDGVEERGKFTVLELPYNDNAPCASSIPEGEYTVSPRYNEKFGHHLIVNDVPGRSWILFHSGNFPDQTQGCILVGMRFGDIDGDGIPDNLSSRAAMSLLAQLVTEDCTLTVVG